MKLPFWKPEVDSKARAVILSFLCLKSFSFASASSETVYFDKYGHCQRWWKPFDLDDDVYTLKSTGGDDAHESLNCAMSFQAPTNNAICLTFKDFEISRCDVSLNIYDSKTGENSWRSFTCRDGKPSPMCIGSSFIRVKVSKDRLTQNQGYEFEIKLEKRWMMKPQQKTVWSYSSPSYLGDNLTPKRSTNFGENHQKTEDLAPTKSAIKILEKGDGVSGDEVLFASIGIFVGIVLGVVVLIAILAGVVLYCCYLQNRREGKPGEARQSERTSGQSLEDRGQAETLIEPTAPPVDEAYRTVQHGAQGPTQDLPPPYQLPPPYEEECPTGKASSS